MSKLISREEGYYWVYYEEGWHIAEFDGEGNWYLCGDESCYLDTAFEKISRQIWERSE